MTRVVLVLAVLVAILTTLVIMTVPRAASDDEDKEIEYLLQSENLPAHHVEQLAELDREAIKQAYKEQVVSLFKTLMKDPTDQPDRAMRGILKARKAYSAAMYDIERRLEHKP